MLNNSLVFLDSPPLAAAAHPHAAELLHAVSLSQHAVPQRSCPASPPASCLATVGGCCLQLARILGLYALCVATRYSILVCGRPCKVIKLPPAAGGRGEVREAPARELRSIGGSQKRAVTETNAHTCYTRGQKQAALAASSDHTQAVSIGKHVKCVWHRPYCG